MNGHRNRDITHCKRGHEFTSANIRRRADGSRGCIACQRAADAIRPPRVHGLPLGTGECLHCGETFQKTRHRQKYGTPECAKAAAVVIRKQAVNRNSTEYQRQHRYGLTPDAFRSMFAAQDGRCGICRAELVGPHVDHLHGTKIVRGILCQSCNLMLGHARDDMDILFAAIGYLRATRLRVVV